MAWPGTARMGRAGIGEAVRGKDRRGKAWQGLARLRTAWPGSVGLGLAWLGKVACSYKSGHAFFVNTHFPHTARAVVVSRKP